MNSSIFFDKATTPTPVALADALGSTYTLWQNICTMVNQKYPAGISEWNFSGVKYGWSFRIKDKKKSHYIFTAQGKIFYGCICFWPQSIG
ncbi:DUF3788 family protein [Ferruginibacter sp.]|nr:DUF3788 family protein [Ferruginibacter sp.]